MNDNGRYGSGLSAISALIDIITRLNPTDIMEVTSVRFIGDLAAFPLIFIAVTESENAARVYATREMFDDLFEFSWNLKYGTLFDHSEIGTSRFVFSFARTMY